MMEQIGASEAKTHLAALLDRVARGETITIMRHGTPAARLVPVSDEPSPSSREAAESVRALRKQVKSGNLTVRELVDANRRF
jgi:prevent-host-death family protein